MTRAPTCRPATPASAIAVLQKASISAVCGGCGGKTYMYRSARASRPNTYDPQHPPHMTPESGAKEGNKTSTADILAARENAKPAAAGRRRVRPTYQRRAYASRQRTGRAPLARSCAVAGNRLIVSFRPRVACRRNATELLKNGSASPERRPAVVLRVSAVSAARVVR